MAKAKLFLLFTFIFFSADIFAQTYISPYSRYGLGDLSSTHLIKHRAMGSTSIAAMDPNTFSLSNPASYAQVNSFMFESGFSGLMYELQTGNNLQPYKSYDFQLPYLSFALPLLRTDTTRYWQNWGLNVSLTPFSKTSYQSRYKNTASPVPTQEFYAGTGGFSKFSVGSSIRALHYKSPIPQFKMVTKIDTAKQDTSRKLQIKAVKRPTQFFIGGNVGYLFGQQYLSHASELPDSLNAYNLLTSTGAIASGFVFDAGFIIKQNLSPSTSVQLGITANLASKVNARKEEFALAYFGSIFTGNSTYSLLDYANSGGNMSNFSDTVYSVNNEKGTIDLPLGTGVGIQFTRNNALNPNLNKDNSFSFSADVYQRKWTDYKVFGKTEPISDLTSFSGGLSIKPNSRKVGLTKMGNFLRRNEYRAGAKYAQGIYNLNNTLPVDKSLSFGIGMPFYNRQTGASTSFLDFTVEGGELSGTTDANNLQQRYLIISLGIHLSEKGWFRNDRID
ncbi:MAG: hypothetical protein ACXWW0_09025 [Bacteroidia bacterium]